MNDIKTIRQLRRVPGGIKADVIDSWMRSFQRGTTEDLVDVGLTAVQGLVANNLDAFGQDGHGKNLLITGPTSSGKTLAAEILIANHLARSLPLGCVYAVPLKALVTEKFDRFVEIFGRDRVYASSSDWQEYDSLILRPGRPFRIAVVIYEKLYSWLLSLDRTRVGDLVTKLGLVIVDELQMLAELQRGPKLELLLTFLRDYQRRRAGASQLRIVGMGPSWSALREVADWLDAVSIHVANEDLPEARPVPLAEGYARTTGELQVSLPERLREVLPDGLDLPSRVVANTAEELTQKYVAGLLGSGKAGRVPVGSRRRILVYCATKVGAERMASGLALALGQRQGLDAELENSLGDLQETTTRDILGKTIPAGVAFHHGDLSLEERRLVEALFRSDRPNATKLDVVVCTPTLAMGVNLPADYIFFSTSIAYGQIEGDMVGVRERPLTPLEYKNFAGRAGRYRPNPPKDLHGLALFMTSLDSDAAQRELFDGLINRPIDPIEPSLPSSPSGQAPLALAGLAWLTRYDNPDTSILRFQHFMASTFSGFKGLTVSSRAIMPRGVFDVASQALGIVGGGAEPSGWQPLGVGEAAVRTLDRHSERDRYPELVRRIVGVDGVDKFELPGPGKAVAAAGIHVETFAILRRLANGPLPDVLKQPLVVLEELVQAPELSKMYPSRLPQHREVRLLVQGLTRFFRERRVEGLVLGPFAKDLVEGHVGPDGHVERWVPDERHIEALVRVVAAWLWMSGEKAKAITSSALLPDVRLGSVVTLTDQLGWLASALYDVWELLGAPGSDLVAEDDEERWSQQVEWDVERLERRLRFGVPEGLETLATLRVGSWHRERLVDLWNAVGPWDHVVYLLDIDDDEAPPELRVLFRKLKREIRQREWRDDPRTVQERQVSLVRQSSYLGRPVGDHWDALIRDLHERRGQELVRTIQAALRSRPFSYEVVLGSDRSEPLMTLVLPSTRQIGLEIIDTNPVGWADTSTVSRIAPDGHALDRLVFVCTGDIEPFDDRIPTSQRSLLVVTREALAELCALAVDEPERGLLAPDGQLPAATLVESIVAEHDGILRTAADVDALVRRDSGPRPVGALAGRGQISVVPASPHRRAGDALWRDDLDHLREKVRRLEAEIRAARLVKVGEHVELFSRDVLDLVGTRPTEAVKNMRDVIHVVVAGWYGERFDLPGGKDAWLANIQRKLEREGMTDSAATDAIREAKRISDLASHPEILGGKLFNTSLSQNDALLVIAYGFEILRRYVEWLQAPDRQVEL